MNRKPDRARLAGNGAGHALADPPEGIGGELVPPGGIELLDSTLQAEGALLNQVEQFQTFALIFLGNADHKTKVRLHHPLFGAATDPQETALCRGEFSILELTGTVFGEGHHGLHLIAQLDFFSWGEEWNSADGGEIPTDGVAAAPALRLQRLGSCGHLGCCGSELTFLRTERMSKCFQQPFRFRTANRNISDLRKI